MKKINLLLFVFFSLFFISLPNSGLFAKHCHRTHKAKSRSSSFFSFNLNLSPTPTLYQEYTYVQAPVVASPVYSSPVIVGNPYVIQQPIQQVYYTPYQRQVVVSQPVYTQQIFYR